MKYVFAPKSFSSYEQLVKTTGHELLHGTFFASGYDAIDLATGSWNMAAKINSHHAIIGEWENQFIKMKGWQNLNLNTTELPNTLENLRQYNHRFDSMYNGMMKIMKNFLK